MSETSPRVSADAVVRRYLELHATIKEHEKRLKEGLKPLKTELEALEPVVCNYCTSFGPVPVNPGVGKDVMEMNAEESERRETVNQAYVMNKLKEYFEHKHPEIDRVTMETIAEDAADHVFSTRGVISKSQRVTFKRAKKRKRATASSAVRRELAPSGGTTSGANSSPNPPPEPVPGPSRLPSSLSATGYYLDRGHPDPIRVDDGAFANVGHNSKDNVKLVNGYGHFAWSEDASIMVEVINRFGPNVNTVVSVNGTDTTVQCNHVVMAYTQNTKVDYLKWEPAFSDFSKLKGEPTTTTPEVVESIDSWGTLSRSSVAVSKQGTSFSVTHVLGSAVGTVYVYTKNASGNFVLDMTDPSRQETSTLNFNSQNNDYFGRTMQWYSDDALAVSAVVDNSQSTGQGTINFYERNNGATSLNHSFAEAFTPITLTSATPEFGNVFACNANAESLVAADTNKLHVYSRRLQDKAFAKKQSIDVSGNASSMALSEPPLILIAGYEETENVHVYTRPDTDSDFKLKQTISAPAVLGNHFGGVRRFGHTAKMSIDGRMMIVGCNAGASATGGNITSDAVTSGMYLYRWDGDAEQYKTDTPPQYIPRRVGGSTYVHVAGRIPEAKIIAGDPDGANLMVYKQNV